MHRFREILSSRRRERFDIENISCADSRPLTLPENRVLTFSSLNLPTPLKFRTRSRRAPRRLRPQSHVPPARPRSNRLTTALDEASAAAASIPFATLDLDDRLRRNLQDRGFLHTTPIQRATFPLVSGGADLIACAKTGTGKTAAFLLPILQRLLAAGPTVRQQDPG